MVEIINYRFLRCPLQRIRNG